MNLSDRAPAIITFSAVLFGCCLRLARPQEIESQAGEAPLFDRSPRAGVSEPWPALGRSSGAVGVSWRAQTALVPTP